MAFRDENGKITIDEQAAQQDIKNLNRSKESLTTAIDHLKEIIALASEFSGNTTIFSPGSFLSKYFRANIS